MRPLPGNSAFPGNASSSERTADCFTSATTTPHMSYIIADEATVENSSSSSCHPPARTRDPRKHLIYTLLGDGPALSRESNAAPYPPPSVPRSASTLQPREAVPQRPASTGNRYPVRLETPPSTTVSRPMTPILDGVSGPCSAISSSSSRRNSLAGSLSEYQESFVMSAFDTSEAGRSLSNYSGEGVQQFIMPTISVPSRRPFTEVGKSLGRLKILVAGKSGLGKTSLIKAIAHSCQHIVHVDPTLPVVLASAGLQPQDTRPNDPPIAQGTFQITETFASTKPYPPWWKEPTQSNSMLNTGNPGDMILDRNICLIDTPGYQETCRPADTVAQVSHYIESHLQKNRLDSLKDTDVLATVGGGGGLLVDAVLYMLSSSGLNSTDILYLRHLEALTNVIPLLALADTLTSEQIATSKNLIACQMAGAGLRPFTFVAMASDVKDSTIYAISSESGTDHDVMDASLLMSSEYVQPLVPTDFLRLLNYMFSFDGAASLRHAAAKKLLDWRSRHPTASDDSGFSAPSSSSTDRRLLRTRTASFAPLVMRRVPSCSVYEERFYRVQLTNWAADLQRSLANERALQERRAQEQAAAWLRETWEDGASLIDGRPGTGALIQARGRRKVSHYLSRRRYSTGSDALVRHHDPLGLLQIRAEFRWQGALEMVGGIGILGGLAWLLV